MTREEAINRYDRIRYNLLNPNDKEAVDIAFEALREQDVTDTNVGSKTNADHIRSMTDDELTEFLMKLLRQRVDCFAEGVFPYHPCPQDHDCRKCGVDWLKQPYKEDA